MSPGCWFAAKHPLPALDTTHMSCLALWALGPLVWPGNFSEQGQHLYPQCQHWAWNTVITQ